VQVSSAAPVDEQRFAPTFAELHPESLEQPCLQLPLFVAPSHWVPIAQSGPWLHRVQPSVAFTQTSVPALLVVEQRFSSTTHWSVQLRAASSPFRSAPLFSTLSSSSSSPLFELFRLLFRFGLTSLAEEPTSGTEQPTATLPTIAATRRTNGWTADLNMTARSSDKASVEHLPCRACGWPRAPVGRHIYRE
jgi:hypothetical protein